jgi:hypothetical protein
MEAENIQPTIILKCKNKPNKKEALCLDTMLLFSILIT